MNKIYYFTFTSLPPPQPPPGSSEHGTVETVTIKRDRKAKEPCIF